MGRGVTWAVTCPLRVTRGVPGVTRVPSPSSPVPRLSPPRQPRGHSCGLSVARGVPRVTRVPSLSPVRSRVSLHPVPVPPPRCHRGPISVTLCHCATPVSPSATAVLSRCHRCPLVPPESPPCHPWGPRCHPCAAPVPSGSRPCHSWGPRCHCVLSLRHPCVPRCHRGPIPVSPSATRVPSRCPRSPPVSPRPVPVPGRNRG